MTPAVARVMMLQVRAASCGVVGKWFLEVTAVSAIETCADHRTDAFSDIAFLRIRDSASTEYGFWMSSKPQSAFSASTLL
jgi:hypothetical protein